MSVSIYKITNSLTGNFYIGKTSKSIQHRLAEHKRSSRKGAVTHLHSAMRVYGEEVFIIECLEEVPDTEASAREIFWIEELTPHYNMTKGGEGGDTFSGKTHSQSTRQKLRLAHLGKVLTPEHKEKVRLAGIGRIHTEESKQKMRQTILARRVSTNMTPEQLAHRELRLAKRRAKWAECRQRNKNNITT